MERICMSIIIDKRVYRTNAVSINIGYDINQLDLSGAKIQVKFDTKIVGGEGSKFVIRHSDGQYREIDGSSSQVMESSSKGTSHVFTLTITDDILQKSKFLTVTTNGGIGTDRVDLEITNIEIKTLEHVRVNSNLFALKTYQMVKEGLTETSNTDSEVIVINSKQSKPFVATDGEALLESDTGKI